MPLGTLLPARISFSLPLRQLFPPAAPSKPPIATLSCLSGLIVSPPQTDGNGPVQARRCMRLGARGQRGWGARTAVERWRASLALGVRQAVQLSAPRQTAFGSGVSVGDCRFSSPGVAASPVSLGSPGRCERCPLFLLRSPDSASRRAPSCRQSAPGDGDPEEPTAAGP
ncbi:hypothetical protein H8959_000998 [Pygathrix nigripes]